jgi:hypothetical protein
MFPNLELKNKKNRKTKKRLKSLKVFISKENQILESAPKKKK